MAALCKSSLTLKNLRFGLSSKVEQNLDPSAVAILAPILLFSDVIKRIVGAFDDVTKSLFTKLLNRGKTITIQRENSCHSQCQSKV